MADLGEGPRGAGFPPLPPLFWVKKEEMTEGRKAGMVSKIEPDPSLAQSLDGHCTCCTPQFLKIIRLPTREFLIQQYSFVFHKKKDGVENRNH